MKYDFLVDMGIVKIDRILIDRIHFALIFADHLAPPNNHNVNKLRVSGYTGSLTFDDGVGLGLHPRRDWLCERYLTKVLHKSLTKSQRTLPRDRRATYIGCVFYSYRPEVTKLPSQEFTRAIEVSP